MKCRFGATGFALALLVGRATAQEPTAAEGRDAGRPIQSLALVRCVADRPLPCVRVRVEDAGAGLLATAPGSGEGAASEVARWRARLGPYTLQPVAVGPVRGGAPRAVLTLVDVSGSMATNGGMQVARAAVRSFVRDLGANLPPADSASVRAGVAGFASRGVVAGIERAAFTAPSDAARAVDALPAPAGNTGLYAAVITGAERVAAAARALGPEARAALVVVTDGRNDVLDPAGRVRPGDDPGLATGAAGRSEAAAAARRLGVPLFLVGVGTDPDMTELRALAGDDGLAVRTAIDAVALREALAGVDRALTPGREVLFAAPGVERASLARPGWPVDVVRTAAAGPDGTPGRAAHWAGRWPSPLLTAPAFAGAAFGDGGVRPAANAAEPALAPPPAWVQAAADVAPTVGRQGVVALFLIALVAAAWWLPRALWRATAGSALRPAVPMEPGRAVDGASYGAIGAGGLPGAAGAPGVLRTVPLRAGGGMPAPGVPATVAARAAAPGSVRADVQEAPARRPADVTASGARRRDPAAPAGGQTFAVHQPNAPAPGPFPTGH